MKMKRKIWRKNEDERLAKLYPTTNTAKLAQQFGVSVGSVCRKACALGVCKTHEFKAEQSRKIWENLNHAGRATQFTVGLIPWNKGLPNPSIGRSVETQLKPGNKPHGWRPIGAVRQSKDGYQQVKIADTGRTSRDYRFVHHLVWQLHGGTFPPGHALVFKDGNPANCPLENLEMVSRKELMHRNSVHRYGPEIQRLCQLKGALTRQINKHNRNAQETK